MSKTINVFAIIICGLGMLISVCNKDYSLASFEAILLFVNLYIYYNCHK